jgi:uridine kinase
MEEIKEYDWPEGFLAISEIIERAIGDEPLLVTIAGGSCSGKTYLANKLSDHFGDGVVVVNLDDYYRDANDYLLPRSDMGHPIFDCPEAYREDALMETIIKLKQKEMAWSPDYDITTNSFVSPFGRKLNPCPIIIVEGLFAIQFLVAFEKQLKVYLEIDYELALSRRTQRDTEKYGVTAVQVARQFDKKVWPNQINSIAKQENQANIIIHP